MTLRDQILQIVLDVLVDVNTGRPPDNQVEVGRETQLLGSHSGLDSLELVRMLLDIEEHISSELNMPIVLMDERAMSQERSPFRSVNALTNYVVALLESEHV